MSEEPQQTEQEDSLLQNTAVAGALKAILAAMGTSLWFLWLWNLHNDNNQPLFVAVLAGGIVFIFVLSMSVWWERIVEHFFVVAFFQLLTFWGLVAVSLNLTLVFQKEVAGEATVAMTGPSTSMNASMGILAALCLLAVFLKQWDERRP